METGKTATAQVKARGQLTIPKKIRQAGRFEEGDLVSILPVGDSLIITSKKIELDEARRQLKRLVKTSGLTLEELIEGLKEDRGEIFKETYGAKKKA